MMMMKLDDRDIVCEQDYTPLSNAELVEAIERYAAIMHTAPLVDFDLEWIIGPARALLARVEAAEASAAALAARVDELETELAAQQWRPMVCAEDGRCAYATVTPVVWGEATAAAVATWEAGNHDF